MVVRCYCCLWFLRVNRVSTPRGRATQARWRFHATSRDPFYASTAQLSTAFRRGRTKVPRYTDAQNVLASRIGGVSAADAGSPKELPEGKAGDQRAATNAGCEEDQFFGNDLHSNSCRGGDEGGGTSSLVRLCRFYRRWQSPRLEGLSIRLAFECD